MQDVSQLEDAARHDECRMSHSWKMLPVMVSAEVSQLEDAANHGECRVSHSGKMLPIVVCELRWEDFN